jgi:protein-S-isoprenylcysteine O-methyltransferase Ste14
MFAEEFFLRNKFGKAYLDWAAKTPAFWPGFKNWESAGWNFSMKNVLKREYSGFFATFLSFALLDMLKNFFHFGFTSWRNLITPFWLYSLIMALVVFIILRSLKKRTKLLDVKGREFIQD